MEHDQSLRHRSSGAPWWLPSFTGLFLGSLFFVLTFTPSLVPRPPIFQGLIGGLAFFIGYAVGLAARRSGAISNCLRCSGPGGGPQAAAWQDEVRGRLNMPPAEDLNFIQVVLVAAVVAVLLMLLARLLVSGIRAASGTSTFAPFSCTG